VRQVWEVGRRPVNLNTGGLALRIGHWLLPARCLACGARGHAGLDLCLDCQGELPWNDSACARCALPLPRPAALCGACLSSPPPFAAAFAPLRYAAPVDALEARFKFHAGLACGRLLSQLMYASVKAPACDLLVPMPLHRARLAQRGYNQALELARPLAQAWQLPLQPGWLRRLRDSAPQSQLDAAERRRNVRGAFLADTAVLGRRVLLVDDVVTTGSTARAAAKALLAAGAAQVSVLAAARVA